MQVVEAVPGKPALMVRFNNSWLAKQYLPMVVLLAVLGLFALAAGPGLLGYSVAGGVIVSLLALALLGFAALGTVRYRQSRETVVLAADDDGVWVALVPGRPPRIVHLPWTEVTSVRVASSAGPGGHQLMFICFDAPAAASGAVTDPTIAAATVRARASLGTPFVLSDRGKDTDLFAMLRALTPLARAAGVTVQPALPG
jgi:hypothetical protein